MDKYHNMITYRDFSIAIIMTIHNRKEKTLKCLEHLHKTNIKFELYITDDGCTDGSIEAIKEKYPKVFFYHGDGKLFWNRGMFHSFNSAIEHGYDFYLWINDDTDVEPYYLESLLECSNKYNHKAIICGACVNNKSEKIITYGGYSHNYKIHRISNEPQTCKYASGNILLIPSAVQKEVGHIDYYYRHSLGDFDYEARAVNKDIKIIQAPHYYGMCERHQSIPKWRDINYPFKERIRILYSPLGSNPKEQFHFHLKNTHFLKACIVYTLIHIRCLFPKLWGNKYHIKE